MEQCSQGYIMMQLMKSLGIDDGYTTDSNSSGIGIGSNINIEGKKMDFPSFVKEIYSIVKILV